MLQQLLYSTLGRKLVMGVTGILLFLFLIAHLVGNMLIFQGSEAFNHYSHLLVSNPLIYLAEFGLLALFGCHLASGIAVTWANRRARPTPYAVKKPAGPASRKSLASTTMIFSGLVVLLFVPLHIWTLKYGPAYVSTGDPTVRDIHRLVIEIFQSPLQVLWYVIAMVVIGFHLWHGFASAFESWGVRHRRALQHGGHILAIIIAGGFLLIPVIIFFGGGGA